jgi:micrococcal nuclease
MARRRRHSLFTIILLLIIAAGYKYLQSPAGRDVFNFPRGEQSDNRLRFVARVVDGDTLVLDGKERVRLLGVDTPESVDPRRPVDEFGKEAATYTRTLVEGKQVRLEFDQQRKDKYGRTLAYVYLEDGTFVNAELVRQGYAHAYTRFPFRHLEEFRQLERQAREQGRGLWKQH